MDDDDLRRGKPTSHKVFGEALAILAGDALLTEAFRLMARPGLMKGLSPSRRLQAIYQVAQAAGSLGMVGGQTMDILTQGKKVERRLLEYIHTHKTGALISASVCVGGIVGGGSALQCRALKKYGEKLGLAFQIVDDILDVQGEADKVGKAVGKDQARGKAPSPGLFGVEASRRQAERLVQKAIGHLKIFDHRADPLREIARLSLQRTK